MNANYKRIIAVLILVIVFLSGALIYVVTHRTGGEKPGSAIPAETTGSDISIESSEDMTGQIAIPGFETMTFDAGTTTQNVALANPEVNHCYFKISLYLEDGTQLWESDYIEPGKTSDRIVLSKALEKGTYEHTAIKYDCFTMDEDLTPLNGAEIKVILIVK